ncbi:hypothetical protein TL16_g04397 [Triparma laevis f. inornata]|uniref:Uncharacterized protein n=1 Tax=Triparma laevis f. inornata TaxID=1714386 RepID=A0A9W7ABR7_9STRA|nr:hypothetical protein TL16_g04397 [Triparma laevis f. inornata]
MSSSTSTLHSHQISHLIQYRKEPCPLPDSDTETYLSRKERGLSCQLHKLIRSLKSQSPPPLSSLFNNLKANPHGINERNGVGWTVLHLAIYHRLDYEVVEGMLMSVTDELRVKICSTRTLKCGRLPLHFASRFSDNGKLFTLLLDIYPRAVIEKCYGGGHARGEGEG